MELVLTGRAIGASEALAIGLAHRLAPPGEALPHAIALAQEIAGFPQRCLRNDRLSLLEQWTLAEDEAMRNEFLRGLDSLSDGEAVQGAQRFTRGEGRHGRFGD
jgi:enoyl-CoA hydratase